jgi:Mn2+/Fe2+ NRAMP family transporter
LFAILFSLAHLNTASQSGVTLNAVIVIRTIIINGAGGVLFGWLYWSYGLESAILAHLTADVVLHGFVPLVTQQSDSTRSMITGGVFGVVWVITILWSIRAIRRDQKRFPAANDSGAASVEASLTNPVSSSQHQQSPY